MKLWKALGLAGLAGVAATGVIIARDQRQRTQLTPEEIKRTSAASGSRRPTQASGSTDSNARA